MASFFETAVCVGVADDGWVTVWSEPVCPTGMGWWGDRCAVGGDFDGRRLGGGTDVLGGVVCVGSGSVVGTVKVTGMTVAGAALRVVDATVVSSSVGNLMIGSDRAVTASTRGMWSAGYRSMGAREGFSGAAVTLADGKCGGLVRLARRTPCAGGGRNGAARFSSAAGVVGGTTAR
ncbi:hypothetical protein EEB13_30525 [Rhodococcus sp. WS3]|uniref:hypothetical protein n=1 Tax=unclassified Rhodococcus (in: high G+C Gram-positive bacteria) TaxID=192944 RepID=UPI001144D29E|nr:MULTISPECIES: hypothetical protein [unclassified Rhodococcus (in: high G+C Gram-positive bacteria)]ROZ42782.1 hypothetical protein EEB13_30525 [Rhodococcus sp. WS3]RZL20966.1 MAG: hypothetical protein EOP31_30195 [Rhodococcus sp. (in: high G+C Gram-positive bacteria)]